MPVPFSPQQILTHPDGTKVIVVCELDSTHTRRQDKRERTEERRLRPQTGEHGVEEEPTPPVPMCEEWEIIQPQVREIKLWKCDTFKAERSHSNWYCASVVVGVVGAVVFTVATLGAGAAVVAGVGGGLAVAATSAAGATVVSLTTIGIVTTTGMAVGGGLATIGLGGASLLDEGDDFDDYEKGEFLGSGTHYEADEWSDEGTTLERAVGAPRPC